MDFVVAAALVVAFSLVARPVARWNVTAPMVFLIAGAVLYGAVDELTVMDTAVHVLAEVTLIVILFHDASTVRLGQLRSDFGVPLRLLLIGFPVALGVTAAVSGLMIPALGVAGAVLVAAAITPTDAGLGAPTVLNPRVPLRVRRALNVESGLNDGLATPVVLFALSAVAADEGEYSPALMDIALAPVGLAVVAGVAIALLAGRGVDVSAAKGWSTPTGRAVAVLALPVVCFAVALAIGANGFICAFVAGLVFGSSSRRFRDEDEMSETLDAGANVLGYAVWFLAGGLVEVVFRNGFRWQWVAIAILALTVLRVVPVAISLAGSGLRWPTVFFIGWFGPRGLASVVFALLAAEELGTQSPEILDVAGVVAVTVIISVFAHGISAGPLARRYGAWYDRTRPPAEASEMGPHRPRVRGQRVHFGRS